MIKRAPVPLPPPTSSLVRRFYRKAALEAVVEHLEAYPAGDRFAAG